MKTSHPARTHIVMLGRRIICVVASGERVAPDAHNPALLLAATCAAAASAAAIVAVVSSSDAADGFERMLQASVGLAAKELSASVVVEVEVNAPLAKRGLFAPLLPQPPTAPPPTPLPNPLLLGEPINCWLALVVLGVLTPPLSLKPMPSTVSLLLPMPACAPAHWKVMTAPLLLLPLDEDAECVECMLPSVPQGEELLFAADAAAAEGDVLAPSAMDEIWRLLPSSRRRGTPLKLRPVLFVDEARDLRFFVLTVIYLTIFFLNLFFCQGRSGKQNNDGKIVEKTHIYIFIVIHMYRSVYIYYIYVCLLYRH